MANPIDKEDNGGMNPRFVLIFATILLLYVGLNLYIIWNAAMFGEAAFPGGFGLPFWIVFSVFAYGYLAAMLLRRFLPYGLYKGLKLVGAYGMGAFYYSVILLPLADLAVLLLRALGVPGKSSVIITGCTVIVLLAALVLRGSSNAWGTVVRRYEVTVRKAAGDRKALRIMAASDLHLGTTVGKKHLARLLAKAEELKPDLILLPGDVLDDSIEPFVRENMAEVLGRLRAPLGVYACLGNHEYIGGHIQDYVKRMQDIGIEVLIDRVVQVEGFYLAGRKDKAVERFTEAGRLTHKELLLEADTACPVILLDHQPTQFAEAMEAGVDLVLCGHTHRGQMAPNHFITRRLFEKDWGYLRKGTLHAIVSSGFGFWGPPVRIGSRSEVLDIHVTFEP